MKAKIKYWYFTYFRSCVICDRFTKHRERRYNEKPENYFDRVEYDEYACGDHFM